MSEYAREMPEKPTRRAGDIQLGQWLWPIAWMAVAAGLFFLPYDATKIISPIFIVVAVVGTIPYRRGPGYKYPGLIARSLAQRRRGGLPVPEVRPGSIRLSKVKAPINIQITSFQTSARDRENIGSFYHKDSERDTIFIQGDAWSGANTDVVTRYHRENSLAESILDVLNSTLSPVHLTVGLHKGPHNVWNHRDWAQQAYSEKVRSAGRTDFDERPPTNVYERQSAIFSENDLRAQLYARNVRAFVALNVPRPANFLELRKQFETGKISLRQFERKVPLTRLAIAMEQQLFDEGVAGVNALDLNEIKTVARESWDISGLEGWYRRMTAPNSPENVPILPQDPNWPWSLVKPRARRDNLGRLYLDFGTSVHRVVMADRQGKQLMPGALKPLYTSGDLGFANQTSLTVVRSGRLYSGTEESKALTPFILLADAFSKSSLRGDGSYVSLEERMKERQLKERQDKIFLTGNQQMTSNLFVSWGAPNLEVLEEADEAVARHAKQASVELIDFKLEALLMDAFYTANLGSALM